MNRRTAVSVNRLNGYRASTSTASKNESDIRRVPSAWRHATRAGAQPNTGSRKVSRQSEPLKDHVESLDLDV